MTAPKDILDPSNATARPRVALGLVAALGLGLSISACGKDGSSGGTDTDVALDTCFTGSEGCPCGPESSCDPGLVCISGGCVNLRGGASCGDGNLDPGEACDLGAFNDDRGSCKSDCTLQQCGDGVVGASEACDDGNRVDTDDCTNACAFATCGDGIVQVPELCDDGNMVDTDACRNNCLEAVCGDGVVYEGVEACDDGNMVDGDGCETDCSTTVVTSCGNGQEDAGELCFDQVDLLAGKAPTRPLLIDVDGDGERDLVIANTDDDDVWIWPGLGGGAFDVPLEIDVGPEPIGAAVLDFDGDGQLDLVTANRGDDTLTIGFGTTTPWVFDPYTYDLERTPVAVMAYNLAQDATGDIAVATQAAGGATDLRVIRGTGSQLPPFPPLASNPAPLLDDGRASALGAARLVGGGNRYLLVSDTERSRVRAIFVETANNLIQSPDGVFRLPLAVHPHGLAVGDLNDDGADDVVTANWNPVACNYAKKISACQYDTVSVVFGDRSGGAELFLGKQDYLVGKAPWDPAVADFDGDGDLDIATANGYSGTISVLDNDGGGSFSTPRSYRFGPSAETVHLITAELDGDGLADLILVRRAMNTVSVLLSNP